MASGDVVNTGARLQAAAPVNGILVDETTYRSTQQPISNARPSPSRPRARHEPIPVWEAIEARSRFGVDVARHGRRASRRAREGGRTCSSTRSSASRAGAVDAARDAGRRSRDRQEPARLRALRSPRAKTRSSCTGARAAALPYGEGVTYWALSEMVKAHAGILETDSAGQGAGEARGVLSPKPSRRRRRPGMGRGPSSPARRAVRRRARRRRSPGRGIRRLAEVPRSSGREGARSSSSSRISTGPTTACSTSSITSSSGRAASRCSSSAPLGPSSSLVGPGWGGGKPNAATISLAPLSDDDTARLVHALLERSVLPGRPAGRRSSSVPAATPSTPRSSPAWSTSSVTTAARSGSRSPCRESSPPGSTPCRSTRSRCFRTRRSSARSSGSARSSDRPP